MLPALVVAFWYGEPPRHAEPKPLNTFRGVAWGLVEPFADFLLRRGAWLILLFVLLHKIGDTLANLTLRLLLNDLGFSNDEIATYDVGFGFFAYLAGIFLGGVLYTRYGMRRSLLLSLVLMAVSNLSFAALAAIGPRQRRARVHGRVRERRERHRRRGRGRVLLDAVQPQLHRHAVRAAVGGGVGRRTAADRHDRGALIERLGYVDFYMLTTVAALPGVLLCLLLRAPRPRAGHARGRRPRTPGAGASEVVVDRQRRVVGEALAAVDRRRTRSAVAQGRRHDLVVDAPADVVGARRAAVGPPGVVLASGLQRAERVDPARRPRTRGRATRAPAAGSRSSSGSSASS